LSFFLFGGRFWISGAPVFFIRLSPEELIFPPFAVFPPPPLATVRLPFSPSSFQNTTGVNPFSLLFAVQFCGATHTYRGCSPFSLRPSRVAFFPPQVVGLLSAVYPLPHFLCFELRFSFFGPPGRSASLFSFNLFYLCPACVQGHHCFPRLSLPFSHLYEFVDFCFFFGFYRFSPP